MIVFGTRGRVIAGRQIDGVVCDSCGEHTHTAFGVLRYFHIFWIPVFPTQKQAGIECQHCKRTLVDKEVPTHLIAKIRDQVFARKTVAPMFTGLIVIAALIAGGVYMAEKTKRQEAAYLASPMANDYYIVNFTKIFDDATSEYPYGIIKVTSVNGDQVELLISQYSYNIVRGASEAIGSREVDKPDYYVDEAVQLSVSDLLALKAEGAIHSIKRR